MAINIYNPKTKKWEKNSSSLASGIKVVDVANNFVDPTKNVEKCLTELKENIAKVEDDIQYIMENGTGGGGGGGGGGSVFPKLTLDGDSNIKCTTDEIVNLYYFFQSPNYGRGKAFYILNNGEAETIEVSQGKVRKTLGPLNSGTHTLQIYVEDSAGLQSNYLSVTINCGTLELSSDFDPTNAGEDFSINDPINIEYLLSAIDTSETFIVTTKKDDVIVEEVKNVGRYTWNTGGFSTTGNHLLEISAKNSTETSNVLRYNVLVVDSKNLYITSEYNTLEIDYGKSITIDYRLSMLGETSFTAKHYINGELVDTIANAGKTNFWQVGKLQPGEYTFKIVAETKGDTVYTAELSFTTTVTAGNFIPFWNVEDMLLASFNANGKNNSSVNRNIWEDKSGNNTVCNLHGFNYSTNGWVQHDYLSDKTTALTFSGKAYAEIHLNPFAVNYPQGLTIDVLFKIENVGNINAKVLDCKRKDAPFTGVYAGIEKTSIKTRNEEADVKYPEKEFVRLTYVVDKVNKLLKTYTNGTISSLRILRDNDTIITNDKTIILGAERLLDETIGNYSTSAIKSIHIYRKGLSDLEVLQNYIADIDNIDEQLRIRELNCLKIENNEIITHNDLSVPTLTLEGDISKMDNMVPVLMNVSYRDPNNPSKTFSGKTGYVKWQGTSSLQYPIKNYTIELKDGGVDFDFAPKDEWIPESRFTLKADFMESSHSNNIGIAGLYEDMIKKYLVTPPKTFEGNIPVPTPNIANTKPNTRNAIDGFPIKLIIRTPGGTLDMGVYNFNLDRFSHKNYGLYGENKAVSYEIGVNSKNGAGAFADDSWDSIKKEFDYRYHNAGSEEDVTVPATDSGSLQGDRWLEKGKHTELEEMVSWVKNTSPELFEAQFFEFFDVHYTIIYYLVVYTLGIIDNLGKNMVLTTWGRDEVTGNTIWYPQLYDLDSALGLDNSGRMKYDPDVDMASGHFNTSDSVLWTKINNSTVLKECINTIYRHLRFELGLLNAENFMKWYDKGVVEKIGSRFYNEDINIKYTNKDGSHDSQYLYMCNGSRIEQTKRWLEERFIYMDSIFGSLENSKSIIIRANRSVGEKTIRLKTYSPMWVTVSFSDAVGNQFKKYVNRGEWTNFTGTISSDTENNIYITGAKNLMYIDGINQLHASSLLIGEAERLVELDVGRSDYLEGVYLGNNRMLQTLKLNNCPKLGSKTVDNTIDISNCLNIKYVDISNTKIKTLVLNSLGGGLEYLNCSDTKILSFTITNQEYLVDFDITNCPDLSYININSCNSLQSLNCSSGNLIEFNVKNCNKINSVDISNNPRLEGANLSGSENLINLSAQNCLLLNDLNVSNTKLINLNITNCLNIVSLNLNSTNVNTVNLVNSSKLVNLYLKNTPFLKNLNLPRTSVLEVLELENTRITMYTNFDNQVNLKTLNLANSDIMNINFKLLSKLEYLNIINSSIVNLDISNSANLNYLRLSEQNGVNSSLSLLNVSNSQLAELNLKNGEYMTCTNLKVLKVDNTPNLEELSVNVGISSISMRNSNITNTIWHFIPIFPKPLLEVNNMANYTRATLNGTFLTPEEITKLKEGSLALIDDSYIEIFDGMLAGNIFFLDSQPTEFPADGLPIKYVFPDTFVAEHIKEKLNKQTLEDKVTIAELDTITWLGRSYRFIDPTDYKGYFDNLNVKSFKGLEYIKNLTYLNFAGCLYEGSFKFTFPKMEKLDFSFADMPNLNSVTFEGTMENLTTISYAFSNCSSLTSAILPNAINIENANYTYQNCISITDIITNNFNDKLKYLNSSFSGCIKLRNLTIQTQLNSLLQFENVFKNCVINQVNFINNETITKVSEITLFDEIIKVSKKIDLSNLINISEIDSPDGTNSVVEEFNLNNTKITRFDATGLYENEPEIFIDEPINGF